MNIHPDVIKKDRQGLPKGKHRRHYSDEEQMLVFVDKLIQELISNKSYITEFKDLKNYKKHIRYKLKDFSDDVEG